MNRNVEQEEIGRLMNCAQRKISREDSIKVVFKESKFADVINTLTDVDLSSSPP